ncbi:MAG: DUF1203 domain-containing protein [Pseudomonadota bacterium]
MRFKFIPLPTNEVRAFQAGCRDANGLPPERQVSDGTVGCRHCLRNIEEGADCLLVAYAPFSTLQPYAERGPLYICASACSPDDPSAAIPEMLDSPRYLVRGYDADERIIYGTGSVCETTSLADRIGALLDEPGVAFVDIRSAANNCFQCRALRA